MSTKYIAKWFVCIEGVQSVDIDSYLNRFKNTVATKEDLEKFLEAPVLIYYIPTMKSRTDLELIKIEVEDE